MSKHTDNLDMVTFQPFGEETLMSNEEELKQKAIQLKEEKAEKEVQPKSKKTKKVKNDKLTGVFFGIFIAVLFVAYDIFKTSF